LFHVPLSKVSGGLKTLPRFSQRRW
jgi:hypothetical protein